MGLRARLRRLEREAERANTPIPEEYWAAARRETARRIRGALERLARLPSLDGSPVAHLGRDNREFLDDDTPERAEADRRTVEAWEGAHGAPDIGSHAEQGRARLLDMRPKDIR